MEAITASGTMPGDQLAQQCTDQTSAGTATERCPTQYSGGAVQSVLYSPVQCTDAVRLHMHAAITRRAPRR